MATHRIPILGIGTIPNPGVNDVFLEPYSVKATNDVWDRLIVVFNDTSTRIGLTGGFTVPKNYVGNAKFIVVWTSTATSGDVEWDIDYRAVSGDDSESLDQTSNQESLNNNDTAPGAAHRRMECTLTATAGNFAVDDEVEFELFRDGTDGGDTIAAAVMLFTLLFEYTDS